MISGGAGTGWYSVGSLKPRDGEGAIRMPKDPDRPRTTHSWPVGYPRRNGEPWASGCGLTFLAGAGVKGVEGGEWDGEPLRAARRQVLAQRWTLPVPPANSPLRPARPAWPESRPARRGSPGIFGAGTTHPALLRSGVGGPPHGPRTLLVLRFYF